MTAALPLGAALKRGAWITAANWPVVLIDVTIDAIFKLTLAVPILGGAFVVAVLLGADVNLIVAEGMRATAGLVMGSLSGAPIALAAFLVAVGSVGLGGAVLMHLVKGGTAAVLVAGDRQAGEFHRMPFTRDTLRLGAAFSLAAILGGARRYAWRMALLTFWLCVAYLVIAAIVLIAIAVQTPMTASRWAAAWPLLMLIATIGSVVGVAVADLVFDLMRVVVITDDCRTREAARRLRRFVLADARHVLGIFAITTAVVAGATALAVSAAASLAVLAWTPLAGLLVVPLQMAAWAARSVLLQCLTVAALSAYQTQYRRFADAASLRVRPWTTSA